MKWEGFYHPDVSWTVLRRTVAVEFIDMLAILGDVLATRGKALVWNRSFPRRTAYRMAVYRLRKAGLVAYRRSSGRPPCLILTADGERRVTNIFRPEKYWRERWSGRWFFLMYDVPESQGSYRVALRGFLKRMRMGCLQKSVWISCRDIRPAFADLQEAASISDYAALIEARTVLGQTGCDLASRAWDCERLSTAQAGYLKALEGRQRQAAPGNNAESVLSLIRAETLAYAQAMERDPLLPEALWPPNYRGPEVVAAFRRRVRSLSGCLGLSWISAR